MSVVQGSCCWGPEPPKQWKAMHSAEAHYNDSCCIPACLPWVYVCGVRGRVIPRLQVRLAVGDALSRGVLQDEELT